MIRKTLYTGADISLSPVFADGRRESDYVRLIAQEGMAITDGSIVAFCVDVPKAAAGNWTDCPPADAEAATEDDYQNALREMGVRL